MCIYASFPLGFQEALAFEIFPMFVEYSAAMQLNTTLPEEEFIDFQSEPYIKTGKKTVYSIMFIMKVSCHYVLKNPLSFFP